ncbi:MAG: hypothetical protein J0L53_09500 [Spirochaetes bacterium]|nr:hypothetical protein [Spirochaetota bacterium]
MSVFNRAGEKKISGDNMKKLISVFAALALVGAVAAKPAPKKAPAKPAPAVAAPAVPAPAAAAAAATKSESNVQIGILGGYNIHLATSVAGTSVTPTNAGGIYAGADVLFGQNFQYGLRAAYSQTNTTSGAGVSFIPITAQVRFFVIPKAIFIGAFAGYAIYTGVSISPATYTNIPVGGELGYQIDLGGVALDIGGQFTYNIGSISNSGVSVTSNSMFVTPYARLAFKF